MIEIEEIDHALDLARDRAEHKQWAHVGSILGLLRDELGHCGPELCRSLYIAETAGWAQAIDWLAIREEALAVINAYIVKAQMRAKYEDKGRARINNDKKDRAEERRDAVRRLSADGAPPHIVRQRVIQALEGAPSLRTIQDDLKKIRQSRK